MHNLGDTNPAAVHLTVPENFRSRAPGVILHRGAVEERDRWEFEGFQITSPIRTLLDVAASTLDVDQLAGAVRDACERDPAVEVALLERAAGISRKAADRLHRALSMASAA